MARPFAQKHLDKLESIKKDIDNSYKFFRNNYKRFNYFRTYLFKEQIDPNFSGILKELKMPELEFNIIYPYIARLMGEFFQQEPSPSITSISGQSLPDLATINVVQDYFRHKLDEAKESNTISEGLKTLLSGGYGVFKIITEYLHEMSMEQEPRFGLAYAADMCGFDPMAVDPSKGDGRFCWEAFPKTRDELKELAEQEGYNIDWEKISFTRKSAGNDVSIQWSYSNQSEDIALVIDYYFKDKKNLKIVKVIDHPIFKNKEIQDKYEIKNNVMSKDNYDRFVDDWNLSGSVEVPPGIVGKPRNTSICTICRYRVTEGQLLDYTETDFPELPLIFFGNATKIRTVESGSVEEFTMPYGWHAKGMQDLKNYAGNAQANELQRMIQHTFMIAEEALPEADDYKEAYRDVQHATLLVHKAYADLDPSKPLPPPQVVNRQIVPPIITETFQMADQGIQNCMGSYDAQLGINQNQLSGVAIVNGATQNNAVGMPYIECIMVALSRVFTIMLKMMPKYFNTPRTLPVRNNKGKRGYVLINQNVQMNDGNQHQIKFEFDENDLKVKVEAGVNYEIQRMSNLQMINAGMSSNPAFAQFMATKGLKVYVKNLKVTNSDELVEMADEYLKEMQQAKAQAAQQGQQNDPNLIKVKNDQAEIMRKTQKDKVEAQLEQERLRIAEEQLKAKKMELAVKMHETQGNMAIQLDKHHNDKLRTAAEYAVDVANMHHGHAMDHRKHHTEQGELHHKVLSTVLEHKRHEDSESKEQEKKEHPPTE